MKFQRPVIQSGRQPEAEIHQRRFPGTVSLEHAADLRNTDMGLVGEQHKVIRKIVEQGGRGISLLAAIQMPGIVLDAGAVAQFLHHFQIKLRALLQALRLNQLVLGLEQAQPLPKLVPDVGHGPLQVIPVRYVMACRVDDGFPDIPQDFTCQRVDLPDGFNLVSEKFQTQGAFVLIRRNHFQHVAPNPERSPVKIHIIALVLNIHKLGDDRVHADTLADLNRNDQTGIVFRRAKAVDTGHGRDNDNIPARQQGMGSRVPELVDVVVDGRVLLNIRIGRGNIGFRLIIVVVADEIFNGVFRKQRTEFIVKLCCQGLVRGKHQRGPVDLSDDVGHGEGLPRSGNTKQDLILDARFDVGSELLDGRRLIACGDVFGPQLEKWSFGCIHRC